MSEKLRHENHERKIISSAESLEHHKNIEKLRENAEKAAELDPLKNQVESLAKTAETEAISGKEFNVGDKQAESSGHSFGIQKEIKMASYKKTLQNVRKKLPAHDRTLSRVIHQPAVEAVSEVASKTVARPSGFLGGSLVAFLGTAGFLFLTKYFGYSYNYTVLMVLFVGGFALGLILELILRTLLFKTRS